MSTAVREFKGEAKRAEVVELRMQGKTLEAIAKQTGLAGGSSVRYHLNAWLKEQRPSMEQTEELRHLQAAQIDRLCDRIWPMLASDDYLAVVDRLVKLMERKARLFGLDLERGVQVNLLTAEAMAAALEYDAPPAVIEGSAVELEAGETA